MVVLLLLLQLSQQTVSETTFEVSVEAMLTTAEAELIISSTDIV